jgi:hypothetical protein
MRIAAIVSEVYQLQAVRLHPHVHESSSLGKKNSVSH